MRDFFFLNKDKIGNFLSDAENTILKISQICFGCKPTSSLKSQKKNQLFNLCEKKKKKKNPCQCGLTSKPLELWFRYNGFPLPLSLI